MLLRYSCFRKFILFAFDKFATDFATSPQPLSTGGEGLRRD